MHTGEVQDLTSVSTESRTLLRSENSNKHVFMALGWVNAVEIISENKIKSLLYKRLAFSMRK